MAKKMWQFRTENFTVRWLIQPDVLSTEHMTPELAAECKRNVRSRKWKCFQSEIQVVCNATGITLGESYLGGSIYENPADFRNHFGMTAGNFGSYFAQMVKEAISQARERFPAHQAAIAQEVRRKRKVVTVTLNAKSKVKPKATAKAAAIA